MGPSSPGVRPMWMGRWVWNTPPAPVRSCGAQALLENDQVEDDAEEDDPDVDPEVDPEDDPEAELEEAFAGVFFAAPSPVELGAPAGFSFVSRAADSARESVR